MTVLKVTLWGALQGVTEFIPISSSGHLVLIPRLFRTEGPDLIFNIYLHAGTLFAVILFFRKDIIALFTSQKRLGLLVLFATLPISLCGFLFADVIKGYFEYPKFVGCLLMVNGIFLLIGHLGLRNMKNLSLKGYGLWRTFLIGVVQTFAILPGISRSGVTITAGIYAGLDRREAYRFSFLLFIPASILAFFYTFKEPFSVSGFNTDMLIGTISSAIFGLISLKLLSWLLVKTKFYFLGIYCVVLGLLSIVIF